MSKKLRIVVTNKDAIYVNDYRITDRGTKWGVHRTVCEFECKKNEIHKELKERGYERLIRRIDIEEFRDLISPKEQDGE